MTTKNNECSGLVGPIYFVHMHLADEWSDLVENGNPGSSCDFSDRYQNGRDDWIIRTYLELLNRGSNVKLSDHFVPGEICVAHHDHILGMRGAARSYVVSIKADRARTFTCENEIVQSPSSLIADSDYYIPFWPQSNLVPRNPDRHATVQNIAFMGVERNLAARFRDGLFKEKLKRLGVDFQIHGRSSWHNYQEVDLILAIRDGNDNFLASKPASKLVNAWIAGVPAIVGREPAFAALRRSDLDYFRADTQGDVLAVVAKLKAYPELYSDMVRNGLVRAGEISYTAIAEQWEQVLFHEIERNFHKWNRSRSRLFGYYPVMIHLGRTIRRTVFSRKYKRGYDNQGGRVTMVSKIKRHWRRMFSRERI